MLEVIAINLDDIKAINQSQADQIEFCVDIQVGGLSPTFRLLQAACDLATKPMKVMLRFHADSFLISDKQAESLVNFMNQTRHLKFDGYVFGAITKTATVDQDALNKILAAVDKKNITFHKAIDESENVAKNINCFLQHKSINYVLTSGGPGIPENNINTLQQIIHKNQILIGGGVSAQSIAQLKPLGFNNFHIGRKARVNSSYESPISINLINAFKQIINS